MRDLPRVYIDNAAASALKERALWIKRNAVQRVDPGVMDGSLVQLVDKRGLEALAWGFFAAGEKAQRVRVLGFGEPPAISEREFVAERIASAWAYREGLPSLDPNQTNCFRLYHAEADGIGGLVIDWFDGVCVIQANTPALEQRLPLVLEALRALPGYVAAAINKRDAQRAREGLEIGGVEPLDGDVPQDFTIRENGLCYEISVLEGQKTGHYCDQRENRARFEALASALSAAHADQSIRVLDVCAYTGGFSIHAARALGERGEIHAIDSSQNALDQLTQHFEMNQLATPLTKHCGDMGETMRALRKAKQRFHLIALDPPKMVGGRKSARAAHEAYVELNLIALTMLKPGGMLMTHSCSGRLEREAFLALLDRATAQAHRNVRLLGEGGQAADHPVCLHHAPSRYLKTAVLQAE